LRPAEVPVFIVVRVASGGEAAAVAEVQAAAAAKAAVAATPDAATTPSQATNVVTVGSTGTGPVSAGRRSVMSRLTWRKWRMMARLPCW
jgi:hypothetical protein